LALDLNVSGDDFETISRFPKEVYEHTTMFIRTGKLKAIYTILSALRKNVSLIEQKLKSEEQNDKVLVPASTANLARASIALGAALQYRNEMTWRKQTLALIGLS